MTLPRRTIRLLGLVLTGALLAGCALNGPPRAKLPSATALDPGGSESTAWLENGKPSPYQGAAYRPVGVTANGQVETKPAAPPRPPVVQPTSSDEPDESDDSAFIPRVHQGSALAASIYDAPHSAAEDAKKVPGWQVRGQSPDGSGGYAVAQLPPGSGQPQSATPFMAAGYGVNQGPTTVYQPIPSPPPVAGNGVPVQPVFQPPFAIQSPIVSADVPPSDESLNIMAEAQETQTGKLMVGVGVNSDAGVVGNIVIDEQNFDLFRPSLAWNDWVNGTAFRGGGQRLRIELLPGTQVQRYTFNFQEPYLFNMPLSFGVSGFFFQRDYTGWNEERLGGRLSLGYLFPDRPDLSLTTSLGAERVTISNPAVPTPPDLAEVVGNNDLYTARVQLAHDTRDSTFLPTQGHYIALAFEEGFGSFTFPRFEGDYRKYFVMRERPDGSGRHILGLSAKVGVAGSDTPLFEHFFAGGFSSIRGFAFRGASPRQDNIPVGGDFELLSSMEYRFPLTANDVVYGSFFVDAGTVEPDARVYASDFRITPGFELRINVPALGPIPIAVGLGVPVHHAPGDQIQNFHFFVGLSR